MYLIGRYNFNYTSNINWTINRHECIWASSATPGASERHDSGPSKASVWTRLLTEVMTHMVTRSNPPCVLLTPDNHPFGCCPACDMSTTVKVLAFMTMPIDLGMISDLLPKQVSRLEGQAAGAEGQKVRQQGAQHSHQQVQGVVIGVAGAGEVAWCD